MTSRTEIWQQKPQGRRWWEMPKGSPNTSDTRPMPWLKGHWQTDNFTEWWRRCDQLCREHSTSTRAGLVVLASKQKVRSFGSQGLWSQSDQSMMELSGRSMLQHVTSQPKYRLSNIYRLVNREPVWSDFFPHPFSWHFAVFRVHSCLNWKLRETKNTALVTA